MRVKVKVSKLFTYCTQIMHCELQALVNTLKEGCVNNGISLNAVFERNEERTECKISKW